MAIIIGGLLAAGGGYLAAQGTSDAQSSANVAGAQNAARQGSQSFINYLSSRGTNLQQIVANDPRGPQFWNQQYQQSQARGDKRDFQTWLVAAIQSAPGDPIWQVIASPTAGNGAQNTSLPDYVTIGGQPAQPVIAGDATAIYQGATGTTPITSIATLANAHGLLQSNPAVAAELQAAGVGSDGRTPEQWLVDHITGVESQSGGGTFTTALKNFVAGETAAAKVAPGGVGPPGGGPGSGIDVPALVTQNTAVNKNITDLLSGATMASNLAALQPATDARSAAAALQQQLINEQRAGAGGINLAQLIGLQNLFGARAGGAADIYDATATGARGISDASLAGLEKLLGVRTQGAGNIYDATTAAAGGVRTAQEEAAQGISAADLAGLAKLLGVQTTGANDIYGAQRTGAQDVYGAQLLQADTYAQSAEQALARQLAEQQANRARQGFTGASSGSDLERARVIAQYLQAGAGARAGAGVSLQQSLANAGIGLQTNLGAARTGNAQAQLQDAIDLATRVGAAHTGYASNVGTAGINRAGQVAGASEQNALGQLQTGVNLATSLAGAGTARAGSIAGAQEQLEAGRLGANTQLATTQAGLLDTNAAIAKQQADFQNAMDRLNLAISGQKDQLNASGLPNQNASNTLTVQNQQANSLYNELTALMNALKPLAINQASGPAATNYVPGSVLNTQQILGGALTGLGTAVGSTSTANSLADLLKLLNQGSGTGSGTPATFGGYPLGQTNVFGNTDFGKTDLGTARIGTGGW